MDYIAISSLYPDWLPDNIHVSSDAMYLYPCLYIRHDLYLYLCLYLYLYLYSYL